MRSIAQRELLCELSVVVSESALRDRVRVGGGPKERGRRLSLQSQAVLVGEAIIAHDQRRETVRESVDAGTRLVVGTFIRPDNIEARVDARDRESVEGRVAET